MGWDWVQVVSFCIWLIVLTIYGDSTLWPLWSVLTAYEASKQFTLYHLHVWRKQTVYLIPLIKLADSWTYATYEACGQFTLCHFWSMWTVYPMPLLKRVDSLPYATYEACGQFTLCHLWSVWTDYPMPLLKHVDSLPYATYETCGQFTLCHLWSGPAGTTRTLVRCWTLILPGRSPSGIPVRQSVVHVGLPATPRNTHPASYLMRKRSKNRQI